MRALLTAVLLLGCAGCGSSSDTTSPATHDGLFEFAEAGGEPLVADVARVYWKGATKVVSEPLGGGAVTQYSGNIGNCYGVAVADGRVYWTNFDDGTVHAAQIGGGADTTIATGQVGAQHIVAGAGNVFFATHGDAEDAIVTVPGGGGTPTTVVSAPGGGFGVMAVDDHDLYFASPQVGSIQRVALSGGTPAKFVVGGGTAMATHGGYVYWSAYGKLQRADVATGTVELLAEGLPLVLWIDVADDGVYAFLNGPSGTSDEGSVVRVPLEGGDVETLAAHRPTSGAGQIAVGGAYVFWIERAASVMALAR